MSLDKTLDQTVAWVVSVIVAGLVTVAIIVGANYRFAQRIELAAIEDGYCQVKNAPETQTPGYHWEKCK